jgi:uncharacterized membrane protein YphA (DoxX/SURF4 family)
MHEARDHTRRTQSISFTGTAVRALREAKGGILQPLPYSSLFLRIALGLSFLSAVADRFGWWGTFGQPNVAWGSFARFVSYTGTLNWFLPKAMIPALAIIATCAEALLGFCLMIGWHTRAAALLSGMLLILFGVTMTAALGVKAPLNFSVFSAAGGAFLLATCAEFPFSVDNLFRSRRIAESLPQRGKSWA